MDDARVDDVSYPAPVPVVEARARRHVVWFLVALAYLGVWPYFEALNNPNENVRVWMTRAIVEYHTLSIDRVTADWGPVDDKAKNDGHIFSSKAPGTSLLGVPVLWVQTRLWHLLGWPSPGKRAATLALRLGSVVPCAIAFLFAFARFVERRTRSPGARDLLVVGVGLGTLLYPYGILFMGHAQAAMAAFASFILLGAPGGKGEATRATDDDRGGARADRSPVGLGAAGALAATAVVFEYQLLLVAVLLAVYAFWRHRGRAIWFLAGALPPAVALGAYHTALFGRPWDFPYGHLENQMYARYHHSSGFFGLAGPRLVALGTSFFSISYGLFIFSPFLMLGLAASVVRAARRPRAEPLLFIAVAGVLSLFLAGMTHWRGGWCVGPRYIAGVVPFLAAGLILEWRRFEGGRVGGPAVPVRAEALRAVLGGLILVSIFLNAISAATYPHYPELYDNPVFDLALPLLRDGYVPYGLGWALGLPRAWSLLPIGALWAAAAAIALGAGACEAGKLSRRQAVARVGAALLVAALVLVPLSRYGRAPSAAEQHSTTIVRSLWQPAPRR